MTGGTNSRLADFPPGIMHTRTLIDDGEALAAAAPVVVAVVVVVVVAAEVSMGWGELQPADAEAARLAGRCRCKDRWERHS